MHQFMEFNQIGQLVFKILQFYNFSKWQPSAILDSETTEILLAGGFGG